MSHEDKEFLDMVLHAAAQPGLRRGRIIQVGTAQCQQASFQGQLGGAPRLLCRVGEGFGLLVELVDRLGPREIVGVEDAPVVDVPQQMGPAALLGAVIMVVGRVEVADQHASKLIAQDLIHHGFAPSPSQEVPLVGCAEGPDDL